MKRELWCYRFTFATLAAGAALISVAQAARGRSLSGLLGIYAGTVHSYSATAIPRWVVYHLVDLELYLGVLPFVPGAAAAVIVLRRLAISRSERAVAAASLAAVGCLLVLVATIASEPVRVTPGFPALPTAVHERYLFYVAPLFLVFFLVWCHRRREFPRRTLVPLVVLSVLAPLTLPFAAVHGNADFEALALLPWKNTLIAESHVPLAMAVTVGLFSVLLFIRRASFVVLQVGLTAAALFLTGQVAHVEISSASRQVASSHAGAPAWIDRAVPSGEHVAVLWRRSSSWSPALTLRREQALWKAEVFNASLSRFYFLGTPMNYGLPERPARLRGGRLVVPGSAPSFGYVLAPSPFTLDGTVVGRDRRAGLVLYRLRNGG